MRGQRTYKNFEEFEREELRRMDGPNWSLDEIIDDFFPEDFDFNLEEEKEEEF